MVQSRAEDVDQYLAELPDARRGALTELRALCRAELTGFREVMAYGMPGECLRFRTPEKIDFPLVRDLLRATAAPRGPAC
ncbi:hypothetical protein [Streptomyces sp. 058-1L]|uniref:hypothetical protein n=1 Tax=Streptomyces sp. 058-1L TaxID=2789266 RepID=UPI00397EC332